MAELGRYGRKQYSHDRHHRMERVPPRERAELGYVPGHGWLSGFAAQV
jgi:hypothetical protein